MRLLLVSLFCLGLGAMKSAPAISASEPPPVRVIKPDGSSGPVVGCFGKTVAISGFYAFVGDPCESTSTQSGVGAVYRLRRRGAGWVVDQRVDTPNPAFNGNFGSAIAIGRGVLGVGAPSEGTGGYVYEIGGAFNTQMGAPQATTPIVSTYLGYGTSVAAYLGTPSVIGDFFAGATGGTCPAGVHGGFVSSITVNWFMCTPTFSSQSFFGETLVMRGNLALVGAPGASGPSGTIGAGYLYSMGIPFLVEPYVVSLFVPSDPNTERRFGASLDMNDTTVVIGAPMSPGSGASGAGNTWIYRGAVPNWELVAVLSEPVSQPSSAFGSSVALGPDTLWVGSPTTAGGGAIYQYAHVSSGWNIVSSSAPGPEDLSGSLGVSIAADGATWIAGDPAANMIQGNEWTGAVYISAADYLFEDDFEQ